MPILPENKARYPADWPAIAHRIKNRAGWRCEGSPDFPDCRVAHNRLGARDKAGRWLDAHPLEEKLFGLRWPSPGFMGWCGDPPQELRIVRVVLTVAHLDHQPENCDDANLRAWCQRCHLHYDRHHHAETRRERRAVGDLFA
jgi:hypothetical protein